MTPVYSADALARGKVGTGSAGVEGTGGGGAAAAGDDYSALAQPITESVTSRLPRLHSLLLGPGMGRHPAVRSAAAGMVEAARQRGTPVVLDADAVAMVVEDPGAVRGFGPGPAVLTPNANEFRLLWERMERDGGGAGPVAAASGERLPSVTGAAAGVDGEGGGRPGSGSGGSNEGGVSAPAPIALTDQDRVERLAVYLGGATVVLKGRVDLVSDGERTVACAVPGGLKRCGGIGDVLSGTIATALAWVRLQGFEGKEVGQGSWSALI